MEATVAAAQEGAQAEAAGVEDDASAETAPFSIVEAEYRQIYAKIGNEGIRIGKIQGDELLTQQGFDAGFSSGMKLGRACGSLLAAVRTVVARGQHNVRTAATGDSGIDERSKDSLEALRIILFEHIPEKTMERDAIRRRVSELVEAIAPGMESAPLATFLAALEAEPTRG